MSESNGAPARNQPSAKATELARAIRRARGAMGQIEFASVVGRAQSVVSQWENGKSTPSIESLSSIEERLGLALGTLAAEAGYFSPAAADAVGFSSAPIARHQVAGLTDAVRLVRAADEIGFGVRMRSVRSAGADGARWLVEVLAPAPKRATAEAGEVPTGWGQS